MNCSSKSISFDCGTKSICDGSFAPPYSSLLLGHFHSIGSFDESVDGTVIHQRERAVEVLIQHDRDRYDLFRGRQDCCR